MPFNDRERAAFANGFALACSYLTNEGPDLIEAVKKVGPAIATNVVLERIVPHWPVDTDLYADICTEFQHEMAGQKPGQITDDEIQELLDASRGIKRYKLPREVRVGKRS